MHQINQLQDTIVAIATPQGAGALGVIRLSGNNTFSIISAIFKGKDVQQAKAYSLHYGYIVNNKGCKNEEIIDEVLISIFKGAKSYTGDDTIEISCHGSNYILQQILNLCVNQGARLAYAGEFTQRAYLNGKLDLAQAEAVADLIASENKASHEVAINQMKGGISIELQELRQQLIHFTALIELELDFSDEDVEFANRNDLMSLIENIMQKINNLIKSFEYGNAIKNGVPVAIIGKPNAGKSSLLNTLLNENRAIVSEIAGTTRDTIEETITLNGIKFRFIDTAGIRDTDDKIEAIGVDRAKEKVSQAKIVLHLYHEDDQLLYDLKELLFDKIVINIRTKADLLINDKFSNYTKQEHPQISDLQQLSISTKTGENIEQLITMLSNHFKHDEQQSVIITNARHKEALINSLHALKHVNEGLQNNLSGDLLSFHLRETLRYLGSITGQIEIDKDILGAIFSKFCIGK